VPFVLPGGPHGAALQPGAQPRRDVLLVRRGGAQRARCALRRHHAANGAPPAASAARAGRVAAAHAAPRADAARLSARRSALARPTRPAAHTGAHAAAPAQLRTSAHAACASLEAALAAQCAAAVDGHFDDVVQAALAHLAEPRRTCVALQQCACPMHAALPAAERAAAERAAMTAGAALLLSSSDDYEDWWHQLWTSTTSSEAFAAFSEIFWSDSSSFTSEDGDGAVRFESVAFVHPRAFGPLL